MRRLTTVGRGRVAAPETQTPANTGSSLHRVVTAIREEATVELANGTAVLDCPDYDGDPEYERLLELAKGPLPELDDVPADAEERALAQDLTSTISELAASGQIAHADVVANALGAVGAAHQQTMESIRDVLVAAAGPQTPDTATIAALSVLDSFAKRQPDPAPVIHVHTPKHDLHVQVDTPEIHPSFHVDAPAAPDIHVEVHPPTVEVASPQVTVNTPAPLVQAAEAPVVNVTVPAPAAERKPSGVRVEYDDDGFKHFVPVYEDGLLAPSE